MNLLLLDEEEVDGDGVAHVRGRRARHVVEVLRAAPGDRLVAGLWRGTVGEARILAATPELVQLAVRLGDPPPAPSPVSLV
ncbi:MAG: RNA methyltransferase PUA domain-containing protein, partial [Deltaproteobacteria bacterium]